MTETAELVLPVGVSRTQLDTAISRLMDTVNRSGVLFVHTQTKNPYPFGFVFIVGTQERIVSIYAQSKGYTEPLKFASESYIGGRSDRPTFVADFFAKTATAINAPVATLITQLAEDRMSETWRFQGWVDGKHDSNYRDNGYEWQHLWGRIIEITSRNEPELTLFKAVQKFVHDRLKSFATEGQIVLDR